MIITYNYCNKVFCSLPHASNAERGPLPAPEAETASDGKGGHLDAHVPGGLGPKAGTRGVDREIQPAARVKKKK